MSEEDDLSDRDPFFDEVEEPDDFISDAMVKKATYLIHKLAERKGQDFGEIQKKCKKFFAYTNLAKVTMEDGHRIIDKLIELIGREEEQPAAPQPPANPDHGSPKREIKVEPAKKEEEESKPEEDLVTTTMRKSIRAAVDITIKEVVDKEVPVQGLGGFVLEIGKVIFEAKMSEEGD